MACIRQYHKLTIAEANLHRAINLFLEGENGYVNALTLASAAEEILGMYVRKFGGVAAMDTILEGIEKDHGLKNDSELRNLVNHSKNKIKHHDDGDDELLEYDWETESMNMIIRASINLKRIKPETPHILYFINFIRENRPDLFMNL